MKTNNPIENVRISEIAFKEFYGSYLLMGHKMGLDMDQLRQENNYLDQCYKAMDEKRDDYILAMQEIIEEFDIVTGPSSDCTAFEFSCAIGQLWENANLADDLPAMEHAYSLLINNSIYKSFMAINARRVNQYRRKHNEA